MPPPVPNSVAADHVALIQSWLDTETTAVHATELLTYYSSVSPLRAVFDILFAAALAATPSDEYLQILNAWMAMLTAQPVTASTFADVIRLRVGETLRIKHWHATNTTTAVASTVTATSNLPVVFSTPGVSVLAVGNVTPTVLASPSDMTALISPGGQRHGGSSSDAYVDESHVWLDEERYVDVNVVDVNAEVGVAASLTSSSTAVVPPSLAPLLHQSITLAELPPLGWALVQIGTFNPQHRPQQPVNHRHGVIQSLTRTVLPWFRLFCHS
jgi:hypothetical protein